MDKKENVKYPVKFRLKVILENTVSDEENKNSILKILKDLDIHYINFTKNHSSKKKYTSYSATVTVNSKETLYKLYREVEKIKTFKFAI